MAYEDSSEGTHLALYEGVVLRNDDPLKIGRVKFRIQGMIDESDWARPVALPGAGEARQGWFIVPPVGAEVGVWFVQGDPDQPRYAAGHWGAPKGQGSQAPTPVQEVDVKDAQHIRCFETPRFLFTFDDREGHHSVELKDKVSGDGFLLDAETRALRITGTAALILQSVGAVSIEGLAVTINGRAVKDSPDPI